MAVTDDSMRIGLSFLAVEAKAKSPAFGVPLGPSEATSRLPLLGLQPLVLPDRKRPYLSLQLAIACVALAFERAVHERALDRAPGLTFVRAVGEAALGSQRLDVAEGRAEALVRIPELQLTHPRGIEQQAAAGQDDQLASRGRVSAAPVAAEAADRLHVLAA